jgi:hypothetical protein
MLLAPDFEPPGAWLLGVDHLTSADGSIGVSTPAQVAAVAEWLTAITDDDFDHAAADLDDEHVDYLRHIFHALKAFYPRAAAASLAVAATMA